MYTSFARRCPTCSKVFYRQDNYSTHQAKHGTGFDCPIPSCSLPNITAEDLHLHLIHNHGDTTGLGLASELPEAEPEEFDPVWTLSGHKTVVHKKFKKTLHTYSAQLQNIGHAEPSLENLDRIFRSLITQTVPDAEPSDRLGLTLESTTLDFPIVLPYVAAKDLNTSQLYKVLQDALNSNQAFAIDSRLKISLDHIQMPTGSGAKPGRKDVSEYSTLADAKTSKRCIIEVRRDNDNLCFPTALIIAILRYKVYILKEKSLWPKFRQYSRACRYLAASTTVKALKLEAQDLLDVAGVSSASPLGIPELQKIQKTLSTYQIYVFSATAKPDLLFKGPIELSRKLYFVLDEQASHFSVITKPTTFYAYPLYCHPCDKFYHHRFDHKCSSRCRECFRQHSVPEVIQRKYCNECNRVFTSDVCFENHKQLQGKEVRSTCVQIQRCRDCGYSGYARGHVCGVLCKHCFVHYPALTDHKCFITPKKISKKLNHQFIFYDIEAMMIDVPENPKLNKEHIPNLVVAHRVCQPCADDVNRSHRKCAICCEVTFQGTSCIADFLAWVFLPENRDSTCLAHNMSGYDGLFIFRELHKQGKSPEIINRGQKIIQITLKKACIRFVDSLNFLVAPLSSLPKMFGLVALKKGFFPHEFNTLQNQTYIGVYPPKNTFCPDSMKGGTSEKTGVNTGERGDFDIFYETVKDQVFDLQKELYEYCAQDVVILRDACLRFRSDFMIQTGIDPLTQHVTLSQLAMDFFRSKFLKPDTIAKIGSITHQSEERQSKRGMQWLLYIEKQLGRSLVKKSSVGEHKVGPYRVDGYDIVSNTVYEFLGDYFHGNPKVYKTDTWNKKLGKSMGDIYDATLQRLNFIRQEGYSVVSIWETDFLHNSEMQEFAAICEIVTPLQPREALYGGRTNATTLKYEVKKGEKIRYFDFCSLYPSVLKYGKFPAGHPTIILKDFKTLDNYFGLIKCKILPPRDLLMPVLPQRFTNKKLTFTLCRSCASTLNQDLCEHSDAERMLHGTWPTPEVEKALELGYVLTAINEIWHFEETAQFNPTTLEMGLFNEYVDTFFKLKLQYSGWPPGCITEEQKDAYIEKILQREGLKLTKAEIQANPGLRSLSKLLLNSFWGKLAQGCNLPKKKLVKTREEMLELLTDEAVLVESLVDLDDFTLLATYKKNEACVESSPASNVVIASFVTMWGRLKLYDLIAKLGSRCLYFDTDSCFFIDTGNVADFMPQTGSFLGDLTDEIADNNYIVAFVSGGAKNYAFTLKEFNGEFKTKTVIKGISMRSSNINIANYTTVLRKVTEYVQNHITEPTVFYSTENHFFRAADFRIYMVDLHKKYKISYDKRVICSNFTTIPFGFRRISEKNSIYWKKKLRERYLM